LLLVGLVLLLTGCGQTPAASPGFTLALSPATLGSGLDDSVTTHVVAASENGFSGTLALSLVDGSGHPAFGVSLVPASVALAAGQSASLPVTITAAASVPAGSFAFTLRASGGGVTHTAGLTLVLASNATGAFATASGSPLAAGDAPDSVAVADFNGDGEPDLAVALTNWNVVVLLQGNGDGSFQSPSAYQYPVVSHPVAVAVGDFNGDGNADLAVANSGYAEVSVLLGNGDATFQAQKTYYDGGSEGPGGDPTSVAVGDFNGDGNADLAVANVYGVDDVSVLLGNGDGTFQDQRAFAGGTGAMSVAVGDFNGDGTPDLAVADFTGGVSVLLGTGDGAFQSAVSYPVGSIPVSVAVGDFNGDGKLDLATANSGSSSVPGTTVSVLLNSGDGSGTFQTQVGYPVGSSPRSVAVGDFNGDGKPDLAVANDGSSSVPGATVSVLLNSGDGSGTFQTQVGYPVGSSPRSVAVGDFDGDGKLDLATANSGSSNVSVLLGQ